MNTAALKASALDRSTNSPLLIVKHLSKSYGPTVALRNVDIDIRAGEIHALLGENGAGKSTLVKILNGIVAPDNGSMQLASAGYSPTSLMQSRSFGVATAFQELSLLPNLTVAQNLTLPKARKGPIGLIADRINVDAAGAILEEHNVFDIDPRVKVEALSLASRQRLEIVRAMAQRPRLLLLDEPTAALAEPEWLFELLARLTDDGVAVLYISHRLAEVRRLCERGTILRGGASINTVSLKESDDAAIFEMMVGTSHSEAARRAAPSGTRKPQIVVTGASSTTFRDVSFDVCEGEILGIAALEGQGQRELLRCLAGLDQFAGGSVAAFGRPADLSSPAKALKSGIGFLPEERKTEGIFSGLTTRANISISIRKQIAKIGIIRTARERASIRAIGESLDLPLRYQNRNIEALSGGNQQKALLARVMVSGAKHIVLYDPTRGVDVGTKQTIYQNIQRFVADRRSVLVYSTELAEIVQLCDRCLVLYGGRLVSIVSGDELTEDRLVAGITGHEV